VQQNLKEVGMRKLVFILTGAALLALAVPAAAQVGFEAGEHGVDVRIGQRDRDYYRDRDRDRIIRFRDRDEWRERRHRDCDVFWREGRRITVCHRD
jgi:hypothetical protein